MPFDTPIPRKHVSLISNRVRLKLYCVTTDASTLDIDTRGIKLSNKEPKIYWQLDFLLIWLMCHLTLGTWSNQDFEGMSIW